VPRSLESVIRSRVKFWQKRLLLSDWKITVVVGVADDGSTANCDASPEYRQAKLTFDPERMPTDLAEIDSFCLHELLHCYTWRLEAMAENWGRSESQYVLVRDVAETTVTDLERAILNITRRK
jgi:hypothetical protein